MVMFVTGLFFGATIGVIGEPVGKARPRFSRRSGTVYTPSATKKKEQEIEKAWRSGGYMMFPKDVYLRVKIEAFFSIPKAFSKAKHAMAIDGILKPAKKPDADNILKLGLDALNGVAYADDKQIVECEVKKYYGEEPCVYVKLIELEG